MWTESVLSIHVAGLGIHFKRLADSLARLVLIVCRAKGTLSINDTAEIPIASAVKLEQVVMVPLKYSAVGYSKDSDPQLLGQMVNGVLNLNTDGGCALIQNGKFGPMVKQTGHSHALLLPPRQGHEPVTDVVPLPCALDLSGWVHRGQQIA
jgi:hypothetical protein